MCLYACVHDTIDKSEIFFDHLLCALFTSEIEAVGFLCILGTHQRNTKAAEATRTHAMYTYIELACEMNVSLNQIIIR